MILTDKELEYLEDCLDDYSSIQSLFVSYDEHMETMSQIQKIKNKLMMYDEVKVDTKNILTFEIDFNTCDAQTANEIFKMLCKKYPEHTIVLLPKNCSIDCYTKNTAKHMAEEVLKYCEELDEN